ncbi:kelch repeat-containing protein [Flavobacterium sp.]|uniref:kelch repeat-containing protein n=1 Tax=Flavobacterium sp. TaxID=239 RepID=UPI00286CA46A|nr:kelch repeat-containing protein [Flavobacterium sp.]
MKSYILIMIGLLTVNYLNAQTWTQVASMGESTWGAVSFSINNKGYVTTGQNGTVTRQSTWEYNPITDTWSQKANFGGGNRRVASGFSIGDYGYVGTGRDDSNSTGVLHDDFWKYEPVTNTWTQITNYPAGNREALITFSINGYAYVGLGLSYSRKTEFYKFDPSTDSWTQLQNINYNFHLYDTSSFVLNGKGYLATGTINNPATSSGISTNAVFMYDPANDTWTPKNNFPGGARHYGIGFTVANNSYIGLGFSGTFQSDIWKYNEGTDSWTQVDDFTAGGRIFVSTFTLNDKAYIGNGRSFTYAAVSTFYKWEPSLSTSEFQNQTLETVVEKDKILFYSHQSFSNYQLTVYNLAGQNVLSSLLNDDLKSASVYHNLQSGVYILQLNNIINGKKISKKIIVP